MPTWTPRTELYEAYSLFSTEIIPPNPRYYLFSSDIQPGDKGYTIFADQWATPNWTSRTIPS